MHISGICNSTSRFCRHRFKLIRHLGKITFIIRIKEDLFSPARLTFKNLFPPPDRSLTSFHLLMLRSVISNANNLRSRSWILCNSFSNSFLTYLYNSTSARFLSSIFLRTSSGTPSRFVLLSVIFFISVQGYPSRPSLSTSMTRPWLNCSRIPANVKNSSI